MKKLVICIVTLMLSACAYSPQQITINPRIDTEGESYGNGRSIAVYAEDGRDNKALGSRGGIYADTSTITIANDLPQAIVRAVQAKLATQGFNVNSEDSNTRLSVTVEDLSYEVPQQTTVVKKVNLRCVLRVDAQSGGESYTGRYRTTSDQEAMMTPSMERNQEIVNKVLSDTLMRAFSDAKLKAFLSNI